MAKKLPLIFVVLASLMFGASAHAWSTKEHILLTRLAAERLIADATTPPAMRQWLVRGLRSERTLADEKEFLMHARIGPEPRGADGLAFWAVMPDVEAALSGTGDRERKVELFNVSERQLHFVDIEFFQPDATKRNYTDDLSHKPALADFPRDMHDPRWANAGMLPFRVEQCYKQLVEQIRARRLNDKPGQFPRDENAEKWAGMLAHYLEDNTQPQHATIDFRGSYYFKDKVTAPNIHSDVEYRVVDDDNEDYLTLREELWKLLTADLNEVKDPTKTGDLWQATMEILLDGYDVLPFIGHAAQAAYGNANDGGRGGRQTFNADTFFHYKGTSHGREATIMEMKAWRLALAVIRVERVWREAWDEASVENGSTSKGH